MLKRLNVFFILLLPIWAHSEDVQINQFAQTAQTVLAKFKNLFTISVDFYESMSIDIKKKILVAIEKESTATIEAINQLLSQNILSANQQNDVVILKNALAIAYYNAAMIRVFFDSAMRNEIDDQDLLSLIKINKAFQNLINQTVSEEIEQEIFDIAKNFNRTFLVEKNKFISTTSTGQKQNNNYLLNELLKSHLGAFNEFLLQKLPINQSPIISINIAINTLHNYLNTFLPYAKRYTRQTQITPELFLTLNNDFATLIALEENAS